MLSFRFPDLNCDCGLGGVSPSALCGKGTAAWLFASPLVKKLGGGELILLIGLAGPEDLGESEGDGAVVSSRPNEAVVLREKLPVFCGGGLGDVPGVSTAEAETDEGGLVDLETAALGEESRF
jgi:hypothetical protein